MTMASGAMKCADTPTVAMVSAVIGTPNIIIASILRLVSNGASRSMFTAAVIASSGGSRDVIVVVVVVVVVVVLVVVVATVPLAPGMPKSPVTKGATRTTGCAVRFAVVICWQDWLRKILGLCLNYCWHERFRITSALHIGSALTKVTCTVKPNRT